MARNCFSESFQMRLSRGIETFPKWCSKSVNSTAHPASRFTRSALEMRAMGQSKMENEAQIEAEQFVIELLGTSAERGGFEPP